MFQADEPRNTSTAESRWTLAATKKTITLKKVIAYSSFILFFACNASKQVGVIGVVPSFHFYTTKDTFNLKVTDFTPNFVTCYTEAIPYAVVIGEITGEKAVKMPKVVTVLAKCDNSVYNIGQVLQIATIADPTANTTLKPLFQTRDTVIRGQKIRQLIGAEHPAIWGKIL